MTPVFTVLVATRSDRKVSELRALLRDVAVMVIGAAEYLGPEFQLDESGPTLEARAVSKARAMCERTGLPTLADETGLEVAGLDGRPGVLTTEFARHRATDAENNAALLREMEPLEGEERLAQFRTVLAFVTPWLTEPLLAEGVVDGSIARTPRGAGFGYDPLFIVRDRGGRTLAELDDTERAEHSSRAVAARVAAERIGELVQETLQRVDRLLR